MVQNLRTALIFFDYLLLNILFYLILSGLFAGDRSIRILFFLPLLNILWYFISQFRKLYSNVSYSEAVTQFSNFFTVFFVFVLFYMLLFNTAFPQTLLRTRHYMLHIGLYILSLFAGMFIARIGIFLYRRSHRRQSEHINALVVGEESFSTRISGNPRMKEALNVYNSLSITPGAVADFIDTEKLRFRDVDTAALTSIVVSDHVPTDTIENLKAVAFRNMLRLYIVPEFMGVDYHSPRLTYMDGIPLIRSFSEPLEDHTNRLMKRLFDIVFSLLVIVFIFSWLSDCAGRPRTGIFPPEKGRLPQ